MTDIHRAANDRVPVSGDVRIEITALTKRFRRRGGDDVVPVNNVDLSMTSGEIVVLLGPSGCGKTTLLRCVAGLERPDSGEIVVNGQIMFSSKKGIFVPPNRRDIGMMFQSYALWPHLSVLGNVMYPLRTRKISSRDAERGGREALEAVGLGGLEDQYPNQISGGQQQRVALARSIVAGQNLILFDEPLSNVDAKVRQQLRVEILRLQQSLGFSALYVTHDQAEAMELGTRIAVLDNGEIKQIESPQTVYHQPSSRYVANFVGTANLWDGVVTGTSGDLLTVEVAGLAVDVASAGQLRSPAIGERVTVMFRPEDALLAEPGTATGDPTANSLECRVEAGLFAGSHTEYVVSTPEGLTARVWSLGERREATGRVLSLRVPPARIRLLDPATAQR